MNKNQMEEIIGAALEQQGYELVDLIIQAHGSKKLLQFFVDKEGGTNLGDCEVLTDKIDSIITMENLLDGGYILEVSSPGIKRVLKKPAHFKKFIGERARVFTKQPIENRATFTGIIEEADDKKIVLFDGTTRFNFNYEDIKKANLDPVVEF